MMPRFIISVRELHYRETCCRWQGVDTGFSVVSQSIASQNAPGESAIAFADVAPEQEQVEEGDTNEMEAIRLVSFKLPWR